MEDNNVSRRRFIARMGAAGIAVLAGKALLEGNIAKGESVTGATYMPTSTSTVTEVTHIPFVSVKDFGAVGDGDTNAGNDDTAAFLQAIKSNRTLLIPEGTYNISQVVFNSLTNISIIGIDRPTIQGIDQSKSIFRFPDCKNVHVEGIRIGYKDTPSNRTNNILPITVARTTRARIIDVEVFNSTSAGLGISYCNYVKVQDCFVHDTLADGINFSHCGRDIRVIDNTLEKTGDDSIAVYFFQGADPSMVSETDKFTKQVIIRGNSIRDSLARGIIIGGTVGALITGNTIENSRAYGISVHYEPDEKTGVNYNIDFNIANNIIRNAGQNGNDDQQQYAGIAVMVKNMRGKIHNNEIYNAREKGILVRGNANVTNNLIDTTEQGAFLGDYVVANACYGEFSKNTIVETAKEGVFLGPRSTRGWVVTDNTFVDCVTVSNASSAKAIIRATSASGLSIVGNHFRDTRTDQTLNSAIFITGFTASMIERNTLRSASGFSRGILDLDTSNTSIIGQHTERLSSVPTFGYWKIGDFIENTNPNVQGTAGNRYIIHGWKRVTNGTSNVLGTDWAEMRVSTGT